MTARSPLPTTRAPTAGTAFLRGVQRRATLVAWLQSGDPRRVAPILDAAGQGLLALSGDQPMEQWPVRYWGLLLGNPALRGPSPTASWPPALAWLGGLSSGVRAVLLLRLVAQLEVGEIAAVLEVPAGTVHAALRAGLPLHPDGSHDPAAWQARQAALRDALDALPAPSSTLPPVPAAPPVESAPWRRTRGVLWAGVAACLLGLALTFVPIPTLSPAAPGDPGPAEVVPLPPSQAPTTTLEPELALLAHPDLEQLAASGDATVVRDLDFYAWYAARLAERARAGASGADDAP